MSERPDKATICSVVFLDIPDQPDKPAFRQIRDKALFDGIVDEALADAADCLRVERNGGAAIALSGPPEAALFIAMTIRDAVAQHNRAGEDRLRVRAGIAIGPVAAGEIDGVPGMEGDGIIAAERVGNLAAPGQILVSRPYHDITAGLTDEIAGLYFSFPGDGEVYAIRSPEDQPFVPESSTGLDHAVPRFSRLLDGKNALRFGLWGAGALAAIVLLAGGFLLLSPAPGPDLGVVIAGSRPSAPTTDLQAVAAPEAGPVVPVTHEAAPVLEMPAEAEPLVEPPPMSAQEARQSRATRAAAVRSPSTRSAPIARETDALTEAFGSSAAPEHAEAMPEAPAAEHEPEKNVAAAPRVNSGPKVEERPLPPGGSRPKTVWDALGESFRQGSTQRVCTQAEIALNQCK
jgi:hypothetical protein